MALSYPKPFMPQGEIYTGIIHVDFGDKMVSELRALQSIRSGFDLWLLCLLII